MEMPVLVRSISNRTIRLPPWEYLRSGYGWHRISNDHEEFHRLCESLQMVKCMHLKCGISHTGIIEGLQLGLWYHTQQLAPTYDCAMKGVKEVLILDATAMSSESKKSSGD